MFKDTVEKKMLAFNSLARGVFSLASVLLLIEFFDELNYAIEGAALPAIRADLGMTYLQVGMLLSISSILGSLIEPLILMLGDTRLRRMLIVSGGVAVAVSLVLVGSATSFGMILAAMIIGFPASGAFVTLSQATLMDINRGREAPMMARWTVAGSIGSLVGPVLLAGGFWLGFGWRWVFHLLAFLVLLLAGGMLFAPFPAREGRLESRLPGSAKLASLKEDGLSRAGVALAPRPLRLRLRGLIDALARNFWEVVRNPAVLRWILLLHLSDLMLDVFTHYLPLYFTDIAGIGVARVSLLMSVFTLAGLVSDLVLIPLLERFSGRLVVRASAGVVAVLYLGWMLAPGTGLKIFLVVAIKLVTLGWYQVLQGEAYAAAPGRTATVSALGSLTGLVGGAIPWFLGWVANFAGLPTAMWLLLLGPVCLLWLVPRPDRQGGL